MKPAASIALSLTLCQLAFLGTANAGSQEPPTVSIRHVDTKLKADGECAYSFLLAFIGDDRTRAKLTHRQVQILFVNKDIKAGYRTINLKGLALSNPSGQTIESVSASCSVDRLLIQKNLVNANDNPSEHTEIIIVHPKFVGLPIQITTGPR